VSSGIIRATRLAMTRNLCLALALLAPACQLPSSSGGAADGGVDGGDDVAVHICARLDACMIATPGCIPSYRGFVLSTACQAALLNASCSDLSSPSPSGALAACYPPCAAPGTAMCNPDGTYSECTASGYAQTSHCSGWCAARGQTYAGTCSDGFEGQKSATPTCWCR
jgi:hypothetical protein